MNIPLSRNLASAWLLCALLVLIDLAFFAAASRWRLEASSTYRSGKTPTSFVENGRTYYAPSLAVTSYDVAYNSLRWLTGSLILLPIARGFDRGAKKIVVASRQGGEPANALDGSASRR
jgi:hypothetical protein